jgi:hypothetical protein
MASGARAGRRSRALVALACAPALAAAVTACDATGTALVLDDPCWEGPSDMDAPPDLRCTGLYEDWDARRVAWGVRPFSPGTTLWSDGADKQRWIQLPAGTTVDVGDPDQWRFPVGTKVWKEFSLAGRPAETRLLHKIRDDRWLRTSYVWSADGARATRTDRGVASYQGTGYTIPSTSDCDKCHEGRQDRLLGFEAVGLAEASARGLTLGLLGHEQRLSAPVDAAAAQLPDGIPAATRAALAWMHVNCGSSCHNRAADSTANATGLLLKLEVAQLAAARTQGAAALDPVRTTVGVPALTQKWTGETRVSAGAPDRSLLYRLATSRGSEQMPPIVSHLPDPEGTRVLRAWIESLTP